ncbi:MAG: hypothetical protein A2174_01875 [Candidatus Portnoybacteria bacterium RBG_13_41_18]|uniref:POTRA domain-containing protein n=1 Tax=Candidatus Portnoybacteria bacterium RBG_13_41_18 TaxID=1801991 RepID=A0A1G2F5D4_9BACT|nr:MAG: hypothetical protein A2174_01875 [Candidatus Portnoybacteria bacterium RBG_13_41_18]
MESRKFKQAILPRRKKSNFGFKLFIFLGLFFILGAAFFYILVFSSLFKITKIQVSGAKEVEISQIENIAAKVVDQRIFFNKIQQNNPIFSPGKIIQPIILENFPRIKNINIKESFFDHILLIDVEERIPVAIWCLVAKNEVINATSTSEVSLDNTLQAESCYYVDSAGFVFAQAPILSGGLVPIVFDRSLDYLRIKDKISNENTIKFIIDVKKELDVINLNLTDFIIQSQTLGDLEVISPDGWKIYFDLNKPAVSQVYSLKRVLSEEVKEKRAQLEYVDLRVENRVYYKLRQ